MAERKGFFSGIFGSKSRDVEEVAATNAAQAGKDFGINYDGVSTAMLLGTSELPARSRAQILTKWHGMLSNSFVSAAIKLHVTAALGADADTGQMIYIEPAATIAGNKESEKLADEIRKDLQALFNEHATFLAFNAAGFGDSYARVYAERGKGIVSVLADETVYPSLVQPYERNGETVGYIVTTGKNELERLSVLQMVRFKMPRTIYIPQIRSLDKAIKVNLEEDDPSKGPILPSLLGGSFVETAELAYDNFIGAWLGMTGQRIQSANSESILLLNQTGMTVEQQAKTKKSIVDILTKSKAKIADAISRNRPITEPTYHVFPVNDEKQMVTIQPFANTSGSMPYTADDVMFHAKILSGNLGADMSMLGFADLLSGGLGDGGFFRTSIQAAEKSRVIRTTLEQGFHRIIDIHMYYKYGYTLPAGERPYQIVFAASMSALESERQSTLERATTTASAVVQLLDQVKTIGLPADAVKVILSKLGKLDDETAQTLADALAEMPEPEQGGM